MWFERIDFLLRWLVHRLEPSVVVGGSGSLLATHLPTVHWCYVAHRVAGPNMVWVVTGLVERSCGICWMSGRVAVLVPTAAALATSALWCSFLQVHAASGSSTGAGSTLRLVFRQLLGCGQKRVHWFLHLKVCGGSSHVLLWLPSPWEHTMSHLGKNRQVKGESRGFVHSSLIHLNYLICPKKQFTEITRHEVIFKMTLEL